MSEIIEYDDAGTELVQRPSAGLFGTDQPDEILQKGRHISSLLKSVIVEGNLIRKFSGREYVLYEGWTTLAALVGVNFKTEWTRPVDVMGWEAATVVTDQHGNVIGRSEAECLRSEKNWKNRDDYALRSMAQTRATAKALRMKLGFIVVLAGYDPTPADEMPPEDAEIPFEPGRDKPEERLMELARQLNAEKRTELLIKHHAEEHDPATHRGWLRNQIVRAEQQLAERDKPAKQKPPQFQIPEGAT